MMLLYIFLLFLPFLLCRPTINQGRNLSRFQVAVQHCCSSRTSKTPHRCFELNEFSGVNFVASPCRFLKTLEKTLSVVEPADQIVLSTVKPSDQIVFSDVEPIFSDVEPIFSDFEPADQIVKKSADPEMKEKVMSTFQNAVQNCCSNKDSNTAYRCFEVNGVEGVNFVLQPCMFLHNLKNLLEEAAA